LEYKTPNEGPQWDLSTLRMTGDKAVADVSCSTFQVLCPGLDRHCLEREDQSVFQTNETTATIFSFLDLDKFELDCLVCKVKDYEHGTIIFNAFIFCQVSYLSLSLSLSLSLFLSLSLSLTL
jgi:hypothetical protein